MVSFERAYGPLFTLSRCIGLFPYRASRPVSRAWRMASLAWDLILISIGVAATSKDIYNRFWAQFDFFRIARRVLARLWFIFGVANHVYWQIWRPEKMVNVVTRLEWMKNNVVAGNFTWFNIPITIYGLLTYIVVLPLFAWYRGSSWVDIVGGIMIPWTHNVLFIGQFFAFMEAIHCHLSTLNRETMTAKDLGKCCRNHAELCHLVSEVNQVYGLALIMSFASFLISLITQMFQVYERLTDEEQHPAFLITLPWIFGFRTFQMWSLCLLCYEVHYASEEFVKSLCCAMRMKYPPLFDRRLVLYVALKPSVTVHGFSLFVIDTRIIATILSTTVTYFIVLVQLK